MCLLLVCMRLCVCIYVYTVNVFINCMRKRGNFNVPLRVHMVVVVVVVMLIITFHSSYTDCRSKCNCIWMCTHNVWQCVCVFIVCVCVSFCLFFNFLYVLTVQYDYFSHPFNLLSVSGPIISSWLSFHEANADQCDSFVRHIANGWCWIFFFCFRFKLNI